MPQTRRHPCVTHSSPRLMAALRPAWPCRGIGIGIGIVYATTFSAMSVPGRGDKWM